MKIVSVRDQVRKMGPGIVEKSHDFANAHAVRVDKQGLVILERQVKAVTTGNQRCM